MIFIIGKQQAYRWRPRLGRRFDGSSVTRTFKEKRPVYRHQVQPQTTSVAQQARPGTQQ